MLVKKRQPAHAKTIKLYDMFRNRVNREIKKSKNNYYNNYFESHSNDINKKPWQQGTRSNDIKKPWQQGIRSNDIKKPWQQGIRSNDIKKPWQQGIRSIININHSITPTITQLNVNGKLFNKPDEIAEKVNEYFCKHWSSNRKMYPKITESNTK